MKALITILLTAIAVSTGLGGSERSSASLTIYNQNFGLVKEIRTIDLVQGVNTVAIDDVAALIQPETVYFTSLTAPASVGILEQNYQYDLLDPAAVINKSVGKKVRIIGEQGSVVEGTILNPASWEMQDSWMQFYSGRGNQYARGASPSTLVIKTDKGLVLNASGQIELTEMPLGLVSKPRLLWQLNCTKPGTHDAEISYLSQGLNWSADYVAVVSDQDDALDLQGWVTLVNNCGASFRNAKLQLVAGDVRKLKDTRASDEMLAFGEVMRSKGVQQFEEQKLFEYHLYTLQRPTDVLDREKKQVSLLEAAGVKAVKKYYYDGLRNDDWWRSPNWRPAEQYDTSDYKKVNVTIDVVNSTEHGLGMPLPKGTVRVYKRDKEGNQQFVGEDSIDHTPKDEKLRLYVGDAFDVVGERKRTSYKIVSNSSPRIVEEVFEIELRNHDDKPCEVTVVEHVSSDWEIAKSSHKWKKIDARTINFPVSVAGNGAVKVTYTVRTSW